MAGVAVCSPSASEIRREANQRTDGGLTEGPSPCDSPSGVAVSLQRVEGLSRPLGLGWCSGDLTMADMRICCRAWAGVEGPACSWALK